MSEHPLHLEDRTNKGHENSVWVEYNYDDLINSFGYTTLVEASDGEYQGDRIFLLRDSDRYGVLVFGWGSCSGCDALMACDTYADVVELRDELFDGVSWRTREETIEYLRTHDWDGDFISRSASLPFVREALAVLGG